MAGQAGKRPAWFHGGLGGGGLIVLSITEIMAELIQKGKSVKFFPHSNPVLHQMHLINSNCTHALTVL